MPSIPLTGLATSDGLPGNYIEINFAQGGASLGSTEYSVLMLGNKLSTGSASNTTLYGPDTVVPMASEADAIALFGAGSELHRGVRAFMAVNNVSKLYCMPVAESAGADGYVDLTLATTATASGALRVWVGQEFVDAPIATGDTATVIGDAIEDAINGKSHWAVSATNTSGTVRVQAKQHGPRGNDIRVRAQIIGSGVGTTVSPTVSTALSGGATADDNTAALAAIVSTRFYYIISAASDSTQLGALLSQVNTQALPITGIRQRVFGGSTASIANAITLAQSLNGARAEIVWLPEADLTPFELASNACAVYALEEASSVPRCNFSGYGSEDKDRANWKVKAPLSGAKPTRAQELSAINSGLSPIAVSLGGSTTLVKRCTTKSQTSSLPDFRVRDAHKVTVCDRFADDLQAQFVAKFSGKLIGDDPVGNAAGPGPNVITPRVVKAEIKGLVDVYAGRDLLQYVNEIKAGIVVVRESAPRTRMSAQIPLAVIDNYEQQCTQINQVA